MSAGGGLELGEHALKPGLETALFGRSELLGNEKVLEAHERLVDVLQAPLEDDGGWGAHGTGRGLGPHHTQRRSQQLTPIRFVGHAVSGQERESFAQRQAVALHGAQDGVLILLGQGAQGVGQSGTDGAMGNLLFGHGRQVSSDVHPTSYPLGFAPKQTGDSSGAQSLLAHQRADHSGLIQGGKGARW